LKHKVLIVDDEPPARERLGTLLAAHPQLEIVGEAGDVHAAAALCASLLPDLIFLDIQLPRNSGFDLLPLLTGSPAIIFVTAHDRFATRAFDVAASDYLLKPIHPERLALAIERLRLPSSDTQLPLALPLPRPTLDHINIKEDGLLRSLPLSSVSHITSHDNYSSVHLLDHPPAFVRRSLADWEKMLPPEEFIRVDRSLIVRLAAIIALRTDTRDLAELIITGKDDPIPLGRRASLAIRRSLSTV